MHSDQAMAFLSRDHQHLRLCAVTRPSGPEYLLVTTSGRIVARRADHAGQSWLLVYGHRTAPACTPVFGLDLTRNLACAQLRPFNDPD